MRAILALAVLLSGCASTEMRSYVGRSVDEVLIAYGRPENVFQLQDGRRAYQFRWGGGAVVAPGTSTSTASTIGSVTTITSTATPAMLYESAGCLITFIAKESDQGYIIDEYRVPRQLVC